MILDGTLIDIHPSHQYVNLLFLSIVLFRDYFRGRIKFEDFYGDQFFKKNYFWPPALFILFDFFATLSSSLQKLPKNKDRIGKVFNLRNYGNEQLW